MDFDSFLNAVIPFIIAIFGIWIMYKPLAPALSGFANFVKNIFSPLIYRAQDKVDEIELNGNKEIFYE